jgi:hypothetical protein
VLRIEADLRDHYWYDELVNEGIRELEDYLALWAAYRAALDEAARSSSPS